MRNWTEQDQSLWIETPDPFHFRVNLDYLERDKNECMYEVIDDRILKIIEINNLSVLVRISAPQKDKLKIEFLAGTMPTTLVEKEAIVEYVYDWFDLDRDLMSFYEMAKNDHLLQDAIDRFYGLRIVGIPDLFEALCWGVLGQQINLKFAYTLKRQFVEKFGKSMSYKGKEYWMFPSYEKIATLTVEDMANIKMTAKKSEYIIGIAKLMESGQLTKEKLLHMKDFKRVEKALVKIHGIGPWTANYLLMRCLRYPQAFPIADVGLMNAIKFQLDMDRKPTKQEILELASGWKDWEAYATFYLWRVRY